LAFFSREKLPNMNEVHGLGIFVHKNAKRKRSFMLFVLTIFIDVKSSFADVFKGYLSRFVVLTLRRKNNLL